jgi:cellulose synthase/poly-beta-1,6-N-acetylglucosamine synthase-like glycosyltransferase
MSIDVTRSWALPTEVSAPEPGSDLPFTDWQAAELVTFLGHRPRHSGIAVVVPARDEAEGLRDALASLTSQLVRPDRVIVVVNNPTDGGATESIARGYAARHQDVVTVLVMPGHNKFKKAGALNYGIEHLLNGKRRLPTAVRLLVTMDGDTVLHRHFLARASRVMTGDSRLGGVSAACQAKPVRGASFLSRALMLLQRIEYGRAAFSRVLTNIHTMAGAGAVYRAAAVNDLLSARQHLFEERETNLVEDYETTLALKTRGWRITANAGCVAYTDIMPTMRMLLDQRIRWVRGTMDEWRRYGWLNRVCRRSALSMLLGMVVSVYTWTWLGLLAARLVEGAPFDYRYLILLASWAAYQGLSVRSMGWRIVAFEMSLIPGLAFGLLRNYWVVRSAWRSFRVGTMAWAR